MKLLEDTKGKENGILHDLNKMCETQSDYNNVTSFHHILVLTNPQGEIDNRFSDVIDGLHDFNRCYKNKGNHDGVYFNTIKCIHKKLIMILIQPINAIHNGILSDVPHKNPVKKFPFSSIRFTPSESRRLPFEFD